MELLIDGGIVLTKRAIEPWKGWWHIPGGTVYMRESLEEAVERVAKAELGVGVEIERLLGHIIYRSVLGEKEIEIRVEDKGKGIPDEIKAQLFREGVKFGETGHTGMGLYVIKKTIERYGESVMVEDNKPHGSVFILRILRA